MRRFIIYTIVASLTCAVGITASLLVNSLRALSTDRTNNPSMALNIETETAPSKSYTNDSEPRRCGCQGLTDEVAVKASEPSGEKRPISGGVLNGKAISLPKPAYPAIAKAARASGNVAVQIMIDEQGCVISARAASGHPLLQAAAVQAARQACFTPTRLSGVAVKVTGVIVYRFEPS